MLSCDLLRTIRAEYVHSWLVGFNGRLSDRRDEKKKKENRKEEQREEKNLEMDEKMTYYQSKIWCDDSFARNLTTLMLVR